MPSIKYSHNGSTRDEIRGHLEIMSPYFQPPLAGRCSIRDYSLKLFTHAQREEAYYDDSLIGLVAYYINGKYAYVSNVSVLPDYSGKGIGSILLNKMESTLIGFGVGIVSMETADNDQSIAFYRKNGFDLDRQLENGMRRMVKYLNSETPLVSIICLVYNHANYLRECFEGFIMQRVNFPIEILVHDDASTDGSAEIIKEYTNRYPQLFKPIFQTINQYSKGVHISATYQYPRCRGKYIAVCEGDDYWTDPFKLQRQVDYLEKNQDCGLVYSDYAMLMDNGRKLIHNIMAKCYKAKDGYVFKDLFRGCFIRTVTICFRFSLIKDNVKLPKKAFQGDMALFYEIARKSKIHYEQIETGVYRVLKNSASHFTDWEKWKDFNDSLKTLDLYYLQYSDDSETRTILERKWFVQDIRYLLYTRQYKGLLPLKYVKEKECKIDIYYVIWKFRHSRFILEILRTYFLILNYIISRV